MKQTLSARDYGDQKLCFIRLQSLYKNFIMHSDQGTEMSRKSGYYENAVIRFFSFIVNLVLFLTHIYTKGVIVSF